MIESSKRKIIVAYLLHAFAFCEAPASAWPCKHVLDLFLAGRPFFSASLPIVGVVVAEIASTVGTILSEIIVVLLIGVIWIE